MKTSIILISLLAGAVGANAQQIIWGDYVGNFGITVYAPNPSNPVQPQTGNTSYDFSSQPGGDTYGIAPFPGYGGVPIGGGATGSGTAAYGNGNLFTISLYAAPGVNNTTGLAASIDGGSANAVASALFDNTGGTGIGNAGDNGSGKAGAWLEGLPASDSTVSFPFSGSATLGLVAWYNGNGSLASPAYTYLNSPESGASPIESVSTIGGLGSPPGLAYNLGQELDDSSENGIIESFSLVIVPEPNTIALGVIGVSTFLFRRRK